MTAPIRQLVSSDRLKGRIARSGLLLSGASFFEIAFRSCRNIVLTRLLAADLFGQMATISVVIALFEALSEVGVRQVIIQNKKGAAAEFLNVAWWFSAARGLVLFAIAFAGAPALCAFYDNPELLVPMRAAFAALILGGVASPRVHVLEREFSYFKWIVIKQGSAVAGVLSAIVLSIWMRNIWPLVLGLVIESAGTCLLSHVLLPFRPRRQIDRECLRTVLHYARGMLGLPVLTTIFFNFDVFFIGKLRGMEELGWYYVASRLAMMLVTAFTKTVGPLLTPMFSKIQDSRERIGAILIKLTEVVSLAALPCVVFCAVFARPLLEVLYTEQYGNAATAFALLMFYVFFRVLGMILMSLYLALARQRVYRTLALIRVVIVLAAVYPAITLFGLAGAAGTVLLGMVVMYGLQLVHALRLSGLKANDFCSACLTRPLAYSLITAVPGIGARLALEGSSVLQLACGLVFCLMTWTAIAGSRRFRAIMLELRT